MPAGLEDVWAALTDAEQLAEWFANDVEFDAKPGGTGVFRWDDGDMRHAVVEDVDPERRTLRFRWTDDREVVTCVGFTLEDAPGGTRVTVVETPLRASAVTAEWATALALWNVRRLIAA